MSRSSLTFFAALALVLAGWFTWWSLSRPRAPRAAGLTAAASELGQSGIAPTLVTPAAILPEPAPFPEEPADPLEPPPSNVAVRRPVAAIESPWSAPLDVVVRDARTGEGLPFVRVRARAGPRFTREESDRTGLARLSRAFEAGSLELTLDDDLSIFRLDTVIPHGPPPGGGAPPPFEWLIDIGPTYGLHVDTRSLPEGEHSIAAVLCETGPGGAFRTWSTRRLSSEQEGQRWLRYSNVEHEPAPGWKAVLRLWAPGTFYGGEVSVPATVGLREHLTVEFHASAGGFRGQVTGTEGDPVAAAQVIVLGGRPQGRGVEEAVSSERLDLETDEKGHFEGAAVAPGTHQVIVSSNGRPIVRAEVTISVGEVTERSFVVDTRASETAEVRIEVTDAATGDPVEGVGALIRLGSDWYRPEGSIGAWGASLEGQNGHREMVIGAPGYVPVRVRAWDCVQVGASREYRVRLRRGHGAALVVAEATTYRARAVQGARVFVDDFEVIPGHDGLALIETSAPIESIRCEAPGWLTLDLPGIEPNGNGLGYAYMTRE